MLTYPDIDPAALRIGNFAVHWYGLMYLDRLRQRLVAGQCARQASGQRLA